MMGVYNRLSVHRPCCDPDPTCVIMDDDFADDLSKWTDVSGTNAVADGKLKQTDADCQVITTDSTTDPDGIYVEAILTAATLPIDGEVRISPKYLVDAVDGDQQVYGYIIRIDTSCYEVGVGENGSVLASTRVSSIIDAPSATTCTIHVCWKDGRIALDLGSNVQINAAATDNEGDQAGLFADTTSDTIEWESFSFQLYGTAMEPTCPTCSEPLSCVNAYEQWTDNAAACRWEAVSGSLPTITTGSPGYASQAADASLRSRQGNLRGATTYQGASVIITPKKAGQEVYVYCCDDGTLTAGAWARIKVVSTTGVSSVVEFAIGLGASELQADSNRTVGTSFTLSVCHDGSGVSGQLVSGSTTYSLRATSASQSGAHAGLVFTGMDAVLVLTWTQFRHYRMASGVADASCGDCWRCSATNTSESPSVVQHLPCYLLLDISGLYSMSYYFITRCPDCDDYNGQRIVSYQAWPGLFWLSAGVNPGCGAIATIYWKVQLGYNQGIDSGWYVYVGWLENNTAKMASPDTRARFKLSLGATFDFEDIYSWSDLDIPPNPDYWFPSDACQQEEVMECTLSSAE